MKGEKIMFWRLVKKILVEIVVTLVVEVALAAVLGV
jgi:hypothetical protein